MHYFALIFTVIGIGAGQLFFKSAAIEFSHQNSLVSTKLITMMSCAIGIYSASTVAWVYALTKIQLTNAYPFMALTFIFIPLVSRWLFEEQVEIEYFFGVALIVLGILVTVLSSR